MRNLTKKRRNHAEFYQKGKNNARFYQKEP